MFDPTSISCFRFVSYHYLLEQGDLKVVLDYALDETHLFEETIVFPDCPSLSQAQKQALEKCLFYLHLVAGVSYYKAAVPGKIAIETGHISQTTAAFLEKLYWQGLGEFAYHNNLRLREKIVFPFHPTFLEKPHPLPLTHRTALPLGGGKDSIVALDLLNQTKESLVLLSVGKHRAIAEVAKQAQHRYLCITRKLSAQLFELNRHGAYNGHVPISAILAFIFASAAVIYDFDQVAMANERSANVGNLIYEGREINHQYSKSLEFERDVQEFFQQKMLRHFRYFSLLRPLSELKIAQAFAKVRAYHNIFTSCNQAFRIHLNKIDRWCLNCPKCRFVFLILAPFVAKEELLAIFQHNLLDDASQQQGYEALLAYNSSKPFECVGETQECIAAFTLLASKREWQCDYMVARFVEIFPDEQERERHLAASLAFAREHLLKPEEEEQLNAYLRACE